MAAKNKCLNKFAQLKYLYYFYKKLNFMKPLGRIKNIKGCGEWKKSIFKIGNWWEEMSEPISNKSARRKLKQLLKN